MTNKSKRIKPYQKIVYEIFPIKEKKGGGIIKIEAWEDSNGKIVKYSIAYINHLLFPYDNGRVLGYDNTHNYHHKHYFGEIIPVDNFTTYQNIVERFEQEIKEFIK